MNGLVQDLASKVLDGNDLTREQVLELCQIEGEDLYDLFYWANRIRLRYVGPEVRCCSIVAAKAGGCPEDCKFCSQAARYRTHASALKFLEAESILNAAADAQRRGAIAFGIVNSGLGPTDEELNWLEEIIRRLRSQSAMAICASLGVLTQQQAERLAAMGVTRYNHNLQCSRRFFPDIVTTHTYDIRVETVRAVKAAGMKVCCGGLFGMGESWEDRVDLAFELKRLDVDIVPINFLIPIPGTPLESTAELSPLECLKIISIFRFVLPDKEIKVAGGREVHLRDLQSWIFFAGASALMVGNYLTTCGRPSEQDLQMVADLGLPVAVPDAASPLTGRMPADGLRNYVALKRP